MSFEFGSLLFCLVIDQRGTWVSQLLYFLANLNWVWRLIRCSTLICYRIMDIYTPQRTVFKRLGRSREPYSKNRVCSFWLQGKCSRNPCRFLHTDFLQSKNEEFYGSHQQHNSNKLKFTWRNPKQSASKSLTDSLSISKIATVSKNTTVSGSMSSEATNNGHLKGKKVLTTETPSSEPNNGDMKYKKVLNPECPSSEANNGHDVKPKKKVLTTESPSSVVGSCKSPQQKLCQYWATGNCVHGDKCKDLHSWFSGSGFSLLGKLEMHKKVRLSDGCLLLFF